MPDTRVERDDTPPPPPPPPPERPREVDALRPVPDWKEREPGRPARTPDQPEDGERAPASADRRPEPDALKEVPQWLDTPPRVPPEVDAERAVPGPSNQQWVEAVQEPARSPVPEAASAQRVETVDDSGQAPGRAVEQQAGVDAERVAPESSDHRLVERAEDPAREAQRAEPEAGAGPMMPEASSQRQVDTTDDVRAAPGVAEPAVDGRNDHVAAAPDGTEAKRATEEEPARGLEVDDRQREAPDATAPVEFATNEAGGAYGQAVWGDAAGALDAGEADAFRNWSRETGPITYREINGSLRGLEASTPAVREQIDRLDAGLTHQPVPEDLVVTRQVDSAAAFGQSPERTKGTIQADAGYLATTLGPRGLDHPDADTLIRLHVPAGSEAMYMGSLSEFPSETELLLARDAHYAIDEVKWDDDLDLWVVNATLLPREAR
jgi:hypothetical protein